MFQQMDAKKENLLRSRLTAKTDFTKAEVEAILNCIVTKRYQLSYGVVLPMSFKKDTLLSHQVLNRFAKEKKIRYEDALDVLTEWVFTE